MSQSQARQELARIARILASRSPAEVSDAAVRPAAVALLLRANRDVELFFIKRAEYEGDPWSGQVALPGGRQEDGDATLEHTAIRETREETGFDLARDGMLLGQLDDLRPQTVRLPAVMVRPFVYAYDGPPDPTLSAECAASFWLSLSAFTDGSAWRETVVTARGTQMRRLAFHHEGFVIWGMTERIVSGFLSLLDS